MLLMCGGIWFRIFGPRKEKTRFPNWVRVLTSTAALVVEERITLCNCAAAVCVGYEDAGGGGVRVCRALAAVPRPARVQLVLRC